MAASAGEPVLELASIQYYSNVDILNLSSNIKLLNNHEVLNDVIEKVRMNILPGLAYVDDG